MSNFTVFDTETTSLEKPYCYNIGYQIFNENFDCLLRREYVVEQIWHNLPLFSTAYYAEKRPLYVSAMRAKKAVLEKFGNICQQMIRDFKAFEVETAYAYNSEFDEKVFNFNCDWFKVINPFDNIQILDIRGNAHQFICGKDFKRFCEENELFTEKGNYSTTADTVGKFIVGLDFNEEHTALADTDIEARILQETVSLGAELGKACDTFHSIPRITKKEVIVKQNKQVVFTATAEKIKWYPSKNTLYLD